VWPLLFNVLKIQSRITVLASLAKWKNPVEPRTPYLNVLGIAEFAAGNDKGAIEFFDLNTQSWGPGGPHMVVFRAAALANLGKNGEAQDLISELNRSHPSFPYEQWLGNWLKNGPRLDQTIDLLSSLGLDMTSVTSQPR
jgi:hypothetical protein